ncbi:MAG TPA: LPS export ABC transporter periplasmic protein LptC [Beijerinckiaceae bacterium]|nr:LPS export ABC transporter periplasmic protein LptC [Beijerinckiaceae bacterium]
MAHAAEFMNEEDGRGAAAGVLRRQAAFRAAERHSRRVRRLKALALCGSLAGLVALILVGVFNPFDHLPGHIAIARARLNGSQITMEKPQLSGFKRDGRPYRMSAASGVQNIKTPWIVTLHDINASLTMPDASLVHLVSRKGVYDSKKGFMRLSHSVRIVSSAGYVARLKSADIDLKAGAIASRRPVTVLTRAATIAADALAISDSGADVTFRGDVKTTLLHSGPAGSAREP